MKGNGHLHYQLPKQAIVLLPNVTNIILWRYACFPPYSAARCHSWDGGLKPSLVTEVRPGREATEDMTWTGVGDRDGEPNKRQVEENKHEGSLHVEEN